MEPKVTRGSEVARVAVGPDCWRKTLGWGERTLISEVTLDKNGVVPLHSHPHEQIGYVAKGAIEFTLGEEKVVIRAGDGYLIPGGVPHACLALEDSLALDIFAPVRDEYKT
ncbi:MAG TPA: cupin domain-containing protein [Chloroflexota bacterium]|nr:cupin domain-containing protein [Chloroflexota bacterium]